MSEAPRRQGRLQGRRPRELVYVTSDLADLITQLARDRRTTRSAIAHQLMRKGAGLPHYHLSDPTDSSDD